MKWFIGPFLLLNVNVSNAITIRSQISLTDSGELRKYLEISCESHEASFCQHLCNAEKVCEVPEKLCRDCLTSKSQVFFSVFNELNSTFKSNFAPVSNNKLLYFLKNNNFLSLPHDIFLNMFNPENKEILRKEFEQLCYIKVTDAILLATLNSQKQIEDIVGVICTDMQGTSLVLPVKLNPIFANSKSDFWDLLSAEIGEMTESLVLKMEKEIRHSP
jgi:uncharacterized protein YlbG (UPF0298 family)